MRVKVNVQPWRSGKPIRQNREGRDNVFSASLYSLVFAPTTTLLKDWRVGGGDSAECREGNKKKTLESRLYTCGSLALK